MDSKLYHRHRPLLIALAALLIVALTLPRLWVGVTLWLTGTVRHAEVIGHTSRGYRVRADGQTFVIHTADIRFLLGSRVPVGGPLVVYTAPEYPSRGWLQRFPFATTAVFLTAVIALVMLAALWISVNLKTRDAAR